MSKETLEQVDRKKVINGVINCHRLAIASREQAIERLQEELVTIREGPIVGAVRVVDGKLVPVPREGPFQDGDIIQRYKEVSNEQTT